jgi:alpha-amylase/alpha-mannosidase (GH57 family)
MLTGESTMPWVRLHGIHSYYDMLRLYREFPKSRGTINFVPSLVDQLMSYVEGGQSDTFLDHALVPAEELTHQQKVFLLRHFFTANPERKIEPYGPYYKLYYRLGSEHTHIDYAQAVRFFSTQDYLDLQVYHNLVWFGFAAKDEIPELREMLLTGGHFTEDDKKFVIDSQRKILRNLLEELRTASSSDNVEIATTPYYHPILPLLIDTGIAHRANPKAPLPPVMSAPHLARAQIQRALESMEGWTGTRPRGMWPAEGAVCPEMLPMLAEAGVRWIATDEDIFKKSLSPSLKDLNLYQPFLASHEGADVPIVFRDHGLSDLISFTYSKMPAEKAVDDFIGHIRKIEKGTRGEGCLITVVLDGENPWEFYPDSGKEFLSALFTKLEREGIRTETIGGAIEGSPPKHTIEKLHSGSWISANFDIWIGKAQKNQGWDYIKRTLDDTREALESGGTKSRRAFESLSAACGSDWFWWFDDDFDSAYKGDFDRIFRTHLKNVYTSLERDVPLFLFEPIYRFEEEEASILEPPGFIEPVIDGTESTFFEWANASVMTVHGRSSGAMAVSSTDPFETLSFGFNERAFYVRIDPIDRSDGFKLEESDAINIAIHSKAGREKFRVRTAEDGAVITKVGEDGSDAPAEGVRCAARDVMELAFDFPPLKLSAGDEVTLTIALSRRGIEVRRYSHIHFIVPDETYEQRVWSV